MKKTLFICVLFIAFIALSNIFLGGGGSPIYQDDIARANDAREIRPLRDTVRQKERDVAESHYNLTLRLYVSMNSCGNAPEAIEECKKAIAINPQNTAYKDLLRSLYFQEQICKEYSRTHNHSHSR